MSAYAAALVAEASGTATPLQQLVLCAPFPMEAAQNLPTLGQREQAIYWLWVYINKGRHGYGVPQLPPVF